MTKKQKTFSILDFRLTASGMYYTLFLCSLALAYIYLIHRTDNMVREIEKTKQNIVELRAENITLKSEIIQRSSRKGVEERLAPYGIKEPNRPIIKIIRKDAKR